MELLDLYISLFISFFKIGLFGFGGGYAMLPLMQNEVVDANTWISVAEFTDMVAISQSTPGPISLNMATYVGYSSVASAGYGAMESAIGSAICTLAVSMPSFLIVALFSYLFIKYKEHVFVKQLMAMFRPVVIGLIASAAILLMNGNNFIDNKSILIFSGVFVASYLKINPIILIVIAGVLGYFIYQ